MKRTDWCRQFRSVHHLTARGGFTLVEVLVVMAIMVVLFGMLFVPISSSIDMARAGQSRVQMQQYLQMATQQINRGLVNATYIYLPEYIPIANTPGDEADDTYLINYSNITFQPFGAPDQPAVRYAVMTQEYDIVPIGSFYYCIPTPPDLDNPWILYRMEGERRKIDTNGDGTPDRYVFGAVGDTDEDGDVDGDDEFVIGFWSSRNALTPGRGADIPVTRTICLDAAGYLVQPQPAPERLWAKGYVKAENIVDVFGADGVKLVYIHDGVKFGPLRVANERLRGAGSDTTTFSAEYGYWLGLGNPTSGPTPYTYGVGEAIWGLVGPMLINSSELRPRIVVRRETADVTGDGNPDYVVVMDTDDLPNGYSSWPLPAYYEDDSSHTIYHNTYGIDWTSETGTVSLDTQGGVAAGEFGLASPPGADETWDVATGGSSYGTVISVGNGVYGEEIVDTSLTAVPSGVEITVLDVSGFAADDNIRIIDADGFDAGDPTTYENAIIAAGGISGNTITLTTNLTNSYEEGDLVRKSETGLPPPYYTRAYSSYQVTAPPVTIGSDYLYDEMILPDSVDVTVVATGTTTLHCDYSPAPGGFADPNDPQPGELNSIGTQEFAVEYDPADTRIINIHFANGVSGRPPNPNNTATYTDPGGSLTAFWIEISYDVRRNFSTATGANDQIDVSYSTRAVYNVSLELLPWRYYEDNDSDNIWTPYQHIKGVHLQAQIPIAALGG